MGQNIAQTWSNQDQYRTEWDVTGGQFGWPKSQYNKLIRTYLTRTIAEFERYEDTTNIVFPALKPGTSKEKKGAKREEERMRAFLMRYDPKFSPLNPNILRPNEEAQEEELEAFLLKNIRVALLGDPGAGKSTALRGLFREYEERWRKDAAGAVPIFAALNRWQESESLLAFLQKEAAELAPKLPDLLKEGRVLLLLDGLNELPGLKQDKETQEIDDPRSKSIAEVGREYPKVLCLLSCRVKEFVGGPGWCDLHVQPLRLAQVEAIARAYFEEETEKAAQLVAGLYDSKREKLQTLAEKPFYLKRLLVYYGVMGVIPANPTLLLLYSVDMAIKDEIDKGLLKAAEEAELKERLAMLAFNMTDARQVSSSMEMVASWLYPVREIANVSKDSYKEPEANTIVAKTLLKQGEGCGLLALQGGEVKFAHQLLQEYFCALYLSKNPLGFPILYGIVGPNFKDIWPMYNELNPKIVEDLTKLITIENVIQRSPVAYALGHTKEPSVVKILIDAFNNEKDRVIRSDIVRALGLTQNIKAVEVLLTMLNDNDSLIRYSSAYSLGMIKDNRAVDPLINALKDHNRNVRCFAAGALGEIGDKRAVTFLIPILNDFDYYVRVYTIEALGKIGDMRALPTLFGILKDQNNDLRSSAIREFLNMNERQEIVNLTGLVAEDQIEIWVGKCRDTATWAIEQIMTRQNKG